MRHRKTTHPVAVGTEEILGRRDIDQPHSCRNLSSGSRRYGKFMVDAKLCLKITTNQSFTFYYASLLSVRNGPAPSHVMQVASVAHKRVYVVSSTGCINTIFIYAMYYIPILTTLLSLCAY